MITIEVTLDDHLQLRGQGAVFRPLKPKLWGIFTRDLDLGEGALLTYDACGLFHYSEYPSDGSRKYICQ